MGHEVDYLVINPLKIPNLYLAYGLGVLFSPFQFKKKFRNAKPDFILTDNLESSMAAVMIKSIFKIPFVFNFIDDYSLIASYEQRIPKIADLVITVSPQITKFCLSLGIPKQKLRMIPNGVDTDQFKPGIYCDRIQKELNLKDVRVVLFVGKITKYYRLDRIILAMTRVLKEFPKTKFIFVGDGDDIANLKKLSRKQKFEKYAVFTGFRQPNEVPKIINLSDVCVFPLPVCSALTVFEYMACAKPVVMSRGDSKKIGISKEIIPEDSALLVDATPEDFAKGINFLLRNEEDARQMGKKARNHVTRLHNWDILAHKYLEALNDFLK
jgi:glycosyltransferase involved in cell wall biosynthesis